MMRHKLLTGLLLLGAAAASAYALWPQDDVQVPRIDTAPANRADTGSLPVAASPAPSKKKADAEPADPESWQRDRYPETDAPITLDPVAVESLRQTRLHGDPRTPPIVRSETPEEKPTDAELADPEQYANYEMRRENKLINAFLKASDSEIETIKRQLADAERAGISEAAMAESREKLVKLEAMREQMRARMARENQASP